MMVNNSTNINKTNNHFSPHVTEQNRKRKEITAYTDQKSSASDRHTNVAGLNCLMRSQHSPFLIVYIVKILHILASLAA
jgi:hypothetical protein